MKSDPGAGSAFPNMMLSLGGGQNIEIKYIFWLTLATHQRYKLAHDAVGCSEHQEGEAYKRRSRSRASVSGDCDGELIRGRRIDEGISAVSRLGERS